MANLIWWYLDQASSKQNDEKQKPLRLNSKHVVKYLKDGNIINKKLYSSFESIATKIVSGEWYGEKNIVLQDDELSLECW